jgi:hypothetical protein
MRQGIFSLGVGRLLFAAAMAAAGVACVSITQLAAQEINAGCDDEPSKRLEHVTSAEIPAIERFVARDHFAIGAPDVVIKSISDIFVRYFDIVEEQVPAANLQLYRLVEPSLDTSIIAALHDRQETRLSDLWVLLSRQGKGQAGPLLTDGKSNIFYIRDGKGMLWSLDVSWDDGWGIDIGSIGGQYPWRAGRQVIAR